MTSNEITVSQSDLILFTLLLILTMLVGVVGNAVIIFVYKRKNDDLTSTFFILVLSGADLLVCLIAIPYTLAMEWLEFKITSNLICKTYYLLNTSNTTFSSLLIMAVALDRYLCICHPMRRILTVSRAKILVIILVVFALIIGILAGFNVSVIEREVFENRTINGTLEESKFTDYLCEGQGTVAGNVTITNIFFTAVQQINMGAFILCIISVIVFYSLIFRVVLMVREKNKTLVIKTDSTPSPRTASTSFNNIDNKGKGNPRKDRRHLLNNPRLTNRSHSNDFPEVAANTNDFNYVNSSPTPNGKTDATAPLIYQPPVINKGDPPPEPIEIQPKRRRSIGTLRKMSLKSLRGSELFQNFRSAAMLFVVAVVYIVVFSPSILILLEAINFNIIAFYLYYLNNASNPLIYSFMNRGFRQDLKKLFLRHCCTEKRFNNYPDGTNIPK